MKLLALQLAAFAAATSVASTAEVEHQSAEVHGECFDASCGCPGAASSRKALLRGGCWRSMSAVASQDACAEAGGLWCARRRVSQPREFNEALREVIQGSDCSTRYEVSGDLFGTLTAYNTLLSSGVADLAGVPDKPLAWLAGPLGLSAFLNDEALGCCAKEVSTMAACVCRIGTAVGLVDPQHGVSYLAQVPPHQYVYTVVRASMTNRTGSRDEVQTLVPTWPNLLDVMGSTFPFTLGEGAPRCSPTAQVRRTLMERTYAELVEEHRETFAAFGASASNCKISDPALFLKHADGLCSNPGVARLYFCSFLDANPYFEGTGWTSGGIREYITIPNPPISMLQSGAAEADILRFEIPADAAFSCAR